MERNCNRRVHVNIIAYARALWAATKKKRRNTAIAIIIPMVLLEMVTAAFRGFGSPTGNGGGGSVIYVIYPLFILVCCIAASFGMSRKYEIPVLRVPVWGEWVVRWIIFVLLPFFFFLFVTHLLDIFVATDVSAGTVGSRLGTIPRKLYVAHYILPCVVFLCCVYLFFVPFVLCWFANTCYCYYYKLNFYSTSRVLACWNARHFVGSNRISARNGGGCFSSVVL